MTDEILNVDKVEGEFAKIHHLVDCLFQNDRDFKQQNSNMFHLKIALALSAMV